MNCTRAIQISGHRIREQCHNTNETMKDDIVNAWTKRDATQVDFDERERGVVIHYRDVLIISCFKHHIFIEHNITEECFKEPILFKSDEMFKFGTTFEHQPMVIQINLDDDNGKAFQTNSTLTDNFDKITNGISEMDFYKSEMCCTCCNK